MYFPLAIEPGDDKHAFGVVVPDLPDRFSAGDSLDDAMAQARDAILLHLEGLLDEGKTPRYEFIPAPVSRAHRHDAARLPREVSGDQAQSGSSQGLRAARTNDLHCFTPESLAHHGSTRHHMPRQPATTNDFRAAKYRKMRYY